MDTYDLVSKHPLLAILRNVPLEKTIDIEIRKTIK